MGFWQRYRSLNDEQRRIIKEKRLTSDRSIADTLSLLAPIAAFDQASDQSAVKFGCGAGALLVPLFGTFVIADSIGRVAAMILQIAIVALIVFCIYTAIVSARVDVSDNLRKFAFPLLHLFREDIDPATPVHVEVDLTKPTATNKRTGQTDLGKRGAYRKVVESTYEDPWMQCEAMLADGSRVRWSVVDRIRERRKTKTTPRGKVKTKTKYRKVTIVNVAVTMRKSRYHVAADASKEQQLAKESEKSATIRVKRARICGSLEEMGFDLVPDAVAGVFRAAKRVG